VGDLYITNFEKNKRSSIPDNFINLIKQDKKNDYLERSKKLWASNPHKIQKFYTPTGGNELALNSLLYCDFI
jgi:hypothetical protein